MIPRETVDQILDTARIEDVIGDFVTLRRRGASLVACCPFHNEKTPSFYVTPSKGIYKCFGCGKAGSAVGFVMEYEHCSYTDALKYIAKKYHIDVQETEESAEDIVARQKRESLLLVSEFAQKFFVSQLDTPEGQTLAMAYYRRRGLEDETIRRFGLGWAPSGRTALRDAALEAGYKEEYLLDAGVCVRREDGRVLDKFHSRITFPIHSVSGRVIGFSCRTLRTDDNIPKYINSPDTEIYDKSRSLYGIYLAKADISRMDKCYLVEGNVDVVSMHQLGITNLVASCGTSLTVEQVRLIKKFTSNITIMYDGDKAGIHAALKGIDLVLKEDMDVKVVLFPDGDDPDSFSRKHTLQEVRDFIAGAERDFVSFKTDLLLEGAGNDPLRRAGLINEVADTIALIPDAVKRSVYVDVVARKFGIGEDIIFDRITRDRLKMINDQRSERERERRREDNLRRYNEQALAEGRGPVPVQPPASGQAPVLTLSALETDRFVAPVERELLGFLLTNGTDELTFESDSEYAQYNGCTVADFISGSLDTKEGSMVIPAYKKVYEAYLHAYEAGYPQDTIVRHLLGSPDAETAFVSAQLSVERYQLTVSDFEKSLTNVHSWLAMFVPKALYRHLDAKAESRLDAIPRELSEEGADTDALLSELKRLQDIRRDLEPKIKKQ